MSTIADPACGEPEEIPFGNGRSAVVWKDDGCDPGKLPAVLGIRRGRPVVRPGCLTRGVTLYYGLRREGLDVALCFGVGSPEGEMAGHCWLEMDGLPLLEGTDPRIVFTEVVRVSGSGVTPREGGPG